MRARSTGSSTGVARVLASNSHVCVTKEFVMADLTSNTPAPAMATSTHTPESTTAPPSLDPPEARETRGELQLENQSSGTPPALSATSTSVDSIGTEDQVQGTPAEKITDSGPDQQSPAKILDFVDIVFEGPPSPPEGPRFVEVEDSEGNSISIGTWVERKESGTTYWALRIPDPRQIPELIQRIVDLFAREAEWIAEAGQWHRRVQRDAAEISSLKSELHRVNAARQSLLQQLLDNHKIRSNLPGKIPGPLAGSWMDEADPHKDLEKAREPGGQPTQAERRRVTAARLAADAADDAPSDATTRRDPVEESVYGADASGEAGPHTSPPDNCLADVAFPEIARPVPASVADIQENRDVDAGTARSRYDD